MKAEATRIINRRACPLGLMILAVGAFFLTSIADTHAQKKWEVLEDSVYVSNESANDGDSFWIQHKGRKMKIRLYFVDCPETTDEESWATARLKEQAEYFGTDDMQYALKKGLEAKKFVHNLLGKGQKLTVYTRMEDAMGRGASRVYAMVKVKDQFLSEILTEKGYVRINKRTMLEDPLPENWTNNKFDHHLRQLEATAKRNYEGGWAINSTRRSKVERVLAERSESEDGESGGSAESSGEVSVPSIKQQVVTLARTISAYSILTPGKQVRLLRSRTKVKVMGEGNMAGMVTIRFNPTPGTIYEAQCKRDDLILN